MCGVFKIIYFSSLLLNYLEIVLLCVIFCASDYNAIIQKKDFSDHQKYIFEIDRSVNEDICIITCNSVPTEHRKCR